MLTDLDGNLIIIFLKKKTRVILEKQNLNFFKKMIHNTSNKYIKKNIVTFKTST